LILAGLDAALLASEASPRFALRAATAAAHARVDALYSRLDLSRPDDYARFLLSHAAAFLPVEAALIEAGADALLPGWSSRRRGEHLRADLAALSLSVPPVEIAPRFSNEAERLGGLYVLEGSRLGGAMLVRSVAPTLPTAFLAPETTSSWRAFTTLLDARLTSAAALAEATSAANAVFSVFEHRARAALESTLRAD
jgi:heme oxygenase